MSIYRLEDGRINAANIFTSLRLPLAVVGMVVYTQNHRIAGVVVMIAAAWTDFLDGFVARKTNSKTTFGEQFDPIIDKIFMAMVMMFGAVQIAENGLIIYSMIFAIEIATASITIHAKLNLKQVLVVTWFGKKGMFARMTGVTWLLLATCGSSTHTGVYLMSAMLLDF
jgi:phosphatidylglycerophosphate synthase